MVKLHKNRPFIVCIDSDGCAMDTMNLKHQQCFGPYAVDVFSLTDKPRFIDIWDRINLYSETRGINRFKGLMLALQEYGYEKEINQLVNWVNRTHSLSNQSLKSAIELYASEDLQLALAWSEKVNQGIQQLRNQDAPFKRVKESLAIIKQFADIAVVSSANNEAILDEWTRHDLLPFVDHVFGQDQGSKAFCLEQLKQAGYAASHILMVGDSPGDLNAAKDADVLFFPILCRLEEASWDKLILEGLGKLVYQTFDDAYQQQLITTFQQNLTA